MKKGSILMIVGSLLLLGLFVFPMWNIRLGAPQYPEPLGIDIYVNGLKGESEFDLQNIDGLNHYIGILWSLHRSSEPARSLYRKQSTVRSDRRWRRPYPGRMAPGRGRSSRRRRSEGRASVSSNSRPHRCSCRWPTRDPR